MNVDRDSLETLILQMPTPLALLAGREHRHELVNEAYRQVNAGGRDIIGLTPAEAFPELAGQGLIELLDTVFETGREWSANEHLVRIDRDGQGVRDAWFNLRLHPLRDAQGCVSGILSFAVEVTDQVRGRRDLERLLAESEQARHAAERARDLSESARTAAELAEAQIRTFANVIPALAWTARADGYIDWYNARWYEYTGTTPGDMEGWGWQSVHEPTMLDTVMTRWRECIATGRAFEMTFPLRGADGQFHPFLTRVVPMRDADGVVTRWFGTNTDVYSETRLRVAAEAAHALADAARARTVRLQALTSALSRSATVEDITEAIVTHAQVVLGAVGVVIARPTTDGELVELLRSSDMPDSIRDEWQRFALSADVPLAEVLRSGTPLFLETREEFTTRYPALAPLLDAAGHRANVVLPLIVDQRVLAVLGVAFDTPRVFDAEDRAAALNIAHQCAQALERARLFEAEREARQSAEAANRVKSEFLAVISHELRTPLNAIGGYVELIELGIRGPVTNEQLTDLARIKKSQRHLLGLINGMLNYTRVEAGTVRYAVQDIPVDDALTMCEALIAPQLRAKGLSFRYAGCDTSLRARGDAEKMQQIVLNLLTNAMKFTDSGGRVELGCEVDGADVRIMVTDTGQGIATDDLTRVFEPFVQIDAHLTRTQEGIGLGLAISRDLARGMGGDLSVTSAPGVGSTFTLRLQASS